MTESNDSAVVIVVCDICTGSGHLWLNCLKRLAPCPTCRGSGVVTNTPERRQSPVERYEARRDRQRQEYEQVRNAVFGHYGRACACCGTSADLTIDHVYGGGKEHLEAFGIQGGGFYRWLIANDFPAGFQTLCASCNCSKGGGSRCGRAHPLPTVTESK